VTHPLRKNKLQMEGVDHKKRNLASIPSNISTLNSWFEKRACNEIKKHARMCTKPNQWQTPRRWAGKQKTLTKTNPRKNMW